MKQVTKLIRLLRVGLLLLGLAAQPAMAARYKVMIVTWSGGCEEACTAFQGYLKDQRVDAAFLLRDADGKKAALAGFLAEALTQKVDLIVTHGTNASLGMAGRRDEPLPAGPARDIPKVFMVVADPVGAGLVKTLEETGRPDVTGTYNRVPERVNIETLRAYQPRFRRLGVLFHTDERNSLVKRDELQALSGQMGFELVAREIPLGADGRPRATGIAEQVGSLKSAGVDFVYLGSSTFLRENSTALVDSATAAGLPVLSPYELLARNGDALLSVAARYAEVGRVAGEQADKILRGGVKAGSLPVRHVTRFAVLINMQVAKRLKLFPPLELLQIAETVN